MSAGAGRPPYLAPNALTMLPAASSLDRRNHRNHEVEQSFARNEHPDALAVAVVEPDRLGKFPALVSIGEPGPVPLSCRNWGAEGCLARYPN
jgi:hypothetical protein